ncbi:MAG TPA: hypothetical protein VE685_12995 [Thermoanaerobaculia bacterium]|nr:hypothetical protein [Thermoanaerobaculia bacterium]
MHHKSSLFVVSLLVLLTISAPVNAQGSDAKCEIHVTKPLSGQEVGRETIVEGTATLPPGHHLWVFARRDSYRSDEVWWLQSEGIVNPTTGQWKVIAAIGNQNDIGFEFDIAVGVFAPKEHPVLKAHRSRSLAGDNASLQMPVAACAPVIRVVKKVSH